MSDTQYSVTLDYEVRHSLRARRPQLRVLPAGKVEVVVPRGFALHRVPAFVAAHRDWLQRTRARLTSQRPPLPEIDGPYPTILRLEAIAEEWRVSYAPVARARIGKEMRTLILPEAASARALLLRWLKQRAAEALPPWLEQVSAELGLPYTQVAIRAQKTRWGSCSRAAHISLNCSLLFLSPALVRYLFVHELCHTRHLNHSRRYWALVAKCEPEYAQRGRELRAAGRHVPLWFQNE